MIRVSYKYIYFINNIMSNKFVAIGTKLINLRHVRTIELNDRFGGYSVDIEYVNYTSSSNEMFVNGLSISPSTWSFRNHSDAKQFFNCIKSIITKDEYTHETNEVTHKVKE
jgi:hypothetical protein